jgi:hypothetical protein
MLLHGGWLPACWSKMAIKRGPADRFEVCLATLNRFIGSCPEVRVRFCRIQATDSTRVLGITVHQICSSTDSNHLCALCAVFLPAAATPYGAQNAGLRLGCGTGYSFCRQSSWLLQLFAGWSVKLTDKNQRVMNAAARVVTSALKLEHGLTLLRHVELHWLDITDWIKFRLAVIVYRCLRNMAPAYLTELCMPVAAVNRRYNQLSTNRSNSLCLVLRCQRWEQERFRYLGRQHGIVCLTISNMMISPSTVLKDIWKRFYLLATNAASRERLLFTRSTNSFFNF